jgi:hypothetical protein
VAEPDIRAVENPITEIFDLAEEVEKEAPRIRVSIQTARIFIGFWLLLNAFFIVIVAVDNGLALLLTLAVFLLLYIRRWLSDRGARTAFLILALIAGGLDILAFRRTLIFGLILVPFFMLGLMALGNLREINEFFDFYALRHRIVKGVRDADPVTRIPGGRDPVQRALAFLAGQNREVEAHLRTPGASAVPATLRGRSGMVYPFDGYVQRSPTGLRGWSGFGSPGYAIFVKAYPAPPTATDLRVLKRAVEDVTAFSGVPPSRVIAVWRAEGDARLSDEAYDVVTKETVQVPRRGRIFSCSLQSIAETADGTYDFIPYIPEVGVAAMGPRVR